MIDGGILRAAGSADDGRSDRVRNRCKTDEPAIRFAHIGWGLLVANNTRPLAASTTLRM